MRRQDNPKQRRTNKPRAQTTALRQSKAKQAEEALQENEQRYRTLLAAAQRQAQELALLDRVHTALARELDLPTVFRIVVEAIAETFGYTQVSLFLVQGETLVLQHQVGYDHIFAQIPITQGVSGCVARAGKSVLLKDVRTDPAFLGAIEGIVSEVCVPLFDQGRVVGTLNVESTQGVALSEDDLRLITTLSEHVNIAIERVRLYAAAQRRAEEAETLRQAGAVVTATLRQDEAIENILEQLERVVPYDSASVQLLREGYTETIGGHGWPDPAAVVGQRFPVPGDNPNTVVIQQRRPYTLGNARAAYHAFREEPHSHIQSWLGVPLIVHDRVIGMLAIESTQPDYFTPDHARLATAFADQVAIAIENARLYAEVQQLAITDDLTGLYNRRGFFELGRHEVERACRFRRPLAAIMLDLDHLKEVNDTYSHVIGDQVLVGVAACCRQELREVDLLGRCGGDEFVALLPECDLTDVKRVAERLRQRIAQTAIETDRGPVTITASLGVADLDEGCADLEALLNRADQALLYAAKRAGRNQVSVWMDPGER